MNALIAVSLLTALFFPLHLAGIEGNAVDPTPDAECSIGASPGETCGARACAQPLEKTRWRLIRLGDALVPAREQQRDPHLIFESGHQRVAGSGGCNRISGSYTLTNDQIRFGQLASTRMACADAMETENHFLASLGRVRKWRILGEYLELYDEQDGLLARFEASQ